MEQRKGGRGGADAGAVLISPSHTPKSTDKAAKDLRSNDVNGSSVGKHDKEKGVNVQVILRCRPLNEDELKSNTPSVVTCNVHRREVTAVQNIANKQIDRTFAFDKVFGPASKQKDLFDQALHPIVNEVLEGYNCTIFAYGQTGTGKTYTMEGGGRKTKNGEQLPVDAGVIPRSVRLIFDILEEQAAEYSMKVTFLELYNEEITDLLAPDESKFADKFSDDKSKKPIALMEDGKGGVFVRGLEEEIVYTAGDIYKVLDKGSAKRRTAETLLNKQSSRSHSIFSITIHIKEFTPEGEEMIKCGKLNLVDLAGSENISRSGAKEGRAREAGEINKSLLTLGRVINTLVEHSGHIPYRDSKLTRLLRDSLGGKTKTCIIATISPSIYCLEETLSTLDYAYRAKNIKNKPEINQKMMKSAVMKDLYSEIDRLKQEVFAARERNGIYIPRDRYLQEEAEKKAITEKMERFEVELESKDKHLIDLQDLYNSQQIQTVELSKKLENTQKRLEATENAFSDLEERYKQANNTIKEKEFIIYNLLRSERELVEHANGLRSELANTIADVSGLFLKIERKDKVEEGNTILVQKFRSQLSQQLEALHKTVSDSATQQEKKLKEMEEDMQSFLASKAEATKDMQRRVEELQATYSSGVNTLDALGGELDENSQSTFKELNSQVLMHSSSLEDYFEGITEEAEELLSELRSSLDGQMNGLAAFTQQQREGHLRSIETTRSISKITNNFFQTLDVHASNLSDILKETQTVQDQQLSQLEKKFEDCSASEERHLLEKVEEMLAASNARKKKLVQAAVDGLRRGAADRTSTLQKEMANARGFTCSVKEQWGVYMEEAEECYSEDSAMVESSRCSMKDGFEQCLLKAKMGSDQCRTAQDSLLNLERKNLASIDSVVRNGMEANQALRQRRSLAASAILDDTGTTSKDLQSSILSSMELDRDACTSLGSVISPSRAEIHGLRDEHHRRTTEIDEDAHRFLEEEYTVAEPSCSTPRRRAINLPSTAAIEELRTPPFDDLLRTFWEARSPSRQQASGEAKYKESSRSPLTAIN